LLAVSFPKTDLLLFIVISARLFNLSSIIFSPTNGEEDENLPIRPRKI
jgi:hypothetical protein